MFLCSSKKNKVTIYTERTFFPPIVPDFHAMQRPNCMHTKTQTYIHPPFFLLGCVTTNQGKSLAYSFLTVRLRLQDKAAPVVVVLLLAAPVVSARMTLAACSAATMTMACVLPVGRSG
jgi:hypothetical protein